MTQQSQQPNRYARSQPSRYFPTSAEERNYRQIRVRQDTHDNWTDADPVLAAGEFAYTIAPQTALEPPLPDQCIKVGDGNARWSQLPYLGGRGPQGIVGPPGDGVRIVGVIDYCGPPSADQAPNPDIGDMWIVSCTDRDDTTDGSCMAECDGTAWVWDGSAWQSIGSIQGPPGNNVEYYYQEFAATEGQTEFQLDSEVQVQATFVTINGVILLPNDYTFTPNANGDVLTFLNDTPLEEDDIIMVFSFKGAIDAAVRTLTTADIATLGVRPTGVKSLLREDIKNQQQANWYLLDKIDDLEIPEDQDLSAYETIVKSEAGDADLQSQIDALSASGGYNDAWIQPAIDAGDDTTLADAKAYTDSEVAAITHPDPPDLAPYETIVKSEADDADTLVAAKGYTDQSLVPYETKQKSVADDAATLTSAKSYTDQKFNAVVHPSPTIVSATEPSKKTDGTNWFDTVRLELFVRASDSWLPSSPLGARVTQGEIVQAQIIDEVGQKVGVSGQNEVDTTFRIKSSSKTFISTNGNELSLYNLRPPTDDSHAVNLGYANQHYQRSQKPIGFKIDQSAVCSLSTTPRSGEFCGLNNSSPGSSTSANNYFGNFNAGIRVHIDKLKNPLGETFAPNERYNIAGTVTIFGKSSGKLFFRQSITMVSRDTSHDYVTLTFATRVPTFGTGAITAEAESKYIVIVDGLTAATTSTTLVPEGEPTDE